MKISNKQIRRSAVMLAVATFPGNSFMRILSLCMLSLGNLIWSEITTSIISSLDYIFIIYMRSESLSIIHKDLKSKKLLCKLRKTTRGITRSQTEW